jgi:predicted DNA-binding transcriptional regulator AlpA
MTSFEIRQLAQEVYKLFESNELFPDRFMDIAEASAFTTIPTSTIYKLVQKKQIPYNKKCGRLIFSERKLCQWINGTLEDL